MDLVVSDTAPIFSETLMFFSALLHWKLLEAAVNPLLLASRGSGGEMKLEYRVTPQF